MKVKCNQEGIKKAIEIINCGGIAVYPTDTVYGIGCNPYNKEAIKKIYNIKSRDSSKPLPVLVYSTDIAKKIIQYVERNVRE